MEESYLVCMRVADLDDPVEGSTTTACVECGVDIWISPESRKEMGKVGAMPLCAPCAKRIAQEVGGPHEVHPLADGQVEEVFHKLRDKSDEHPEWLPLLNGEKVETFEALKLTAAMVSEGIDEPGWDWGSIAVMEDYQEQVFPPIPIGDMMSHGIPKEIIARQLLPAMAQAAVAKKVIFGLSAWTLADDSGKELTVESLQDHPDSQERLVLLEITADGVQRLSTALITREGDRVKLGEWHDTEKPDATDGIFVAALVPTLQLIRTLQGIG